MFLETFAQKFEYYLSKHIKHNSLNYGSFIFTLQTFVHFYMAEKATEA